MNPLARLEEALATYAGIAPETTEHILGTFLVIATYVLLRRVARRVITRTISEPSTRYQATAAITYVVSGIALVVLAKIWIAGVTGYATYLGLLSAGLAVALQDPLTNLVGWFFIITRRPFTVGHRIQIGPHIGDVVDIRIFRFVMLEVGNWVHGDQSTGRVVHVPNGMVFKNPVYNYDEGFGYIWNEIEIVVTFGSNWRKAKELLLKNVTEHAERISPDVAAQIADAAASFHVRFGAVTPVVWTGVVESGIKLTVRYLCKPRQRRTSTSHIWESILDSLAAAEDVEIAYPTTQQFQSNASARPRLAGRDPGS